MFKLPIVIAITLCSASTFCQEKNVDANSQIVPSNGFYLKAGIGYAAPQSGNAFPYSYNESGATFNSKPASFSAGWNSTFGVGYFFNEHIGAELNTDIGIANKKSSYSAEEFGQQATGSAEAHSLILAIPSLVLRSGGEKLNFYGRFGIVMPVSNKYTSKLTVSDTSSLVQKDYKYTTRFTVGYSCALGFSYKLAKHIELWGEASLLSFAPYLKDKTMTAFTLNGADKLGTYTAKDRRTDYLFSGSENANATVLNPEPAEETYTLPYSNIGFRAGLSINIKQNTKTVQVRQARPRQKFYFKIGGGYAFGQSENTAIGLATLDNCNGSYNSNIKLDSFSSRITSSSFHVKGGSFSEGINGIISGGYMFSKYIGFELMINSGLSTKKFRYNEKNVYTDSQTNAVSNSNYQIVSHAQVPVLLIPNLVLQTGDNRINGYMRLGVVLPLNDKIIFDETYSYPQTLIPVTNEITTTYTKLELSTQFTVGYSGAMGLSARISKHIRLWGELSMLSFAPYAKESVTKEYTVNGVDKLNTVSTGQTTQEYALNHNNNSSFAQPATPIPFSNIGLNMGVGFHL